MRHTDPLAFWGLALAIAALVLHVPLSMLAHHYAPKVEDYLASLSIKHLTRRMNKLQGSLRASEEAEWSFTRAEWEIYDLCYRGLLVIYLLAEFVSYFSMGVIIEIKVVSEALGVKFDNIIRTFARRDVIFIVVTLSIFALFVIVGNFSFIRIIRLHARWCQNHTEKGRSDLRKEIEELQARARARGIG